MVVGSIKTGGKIFDEWAEVGHTRREDRDAFDDLSDQSPFPKIASRVR
jgi:hypothetical protein